MDEVVVVPPSTFLHGRRTSWASAPPAVAAWVEATLDAPVADWHDRVGGMSIGIACVVTTATGTSRFVKAVNGTENPFALELAVRETELASRLPLLPHTPRILDAGAVTTSEGDRWWVMTTPAAGGLAVRHPWQPTDLTRVLRDWEDVAVVLRQTAWESTSYGQHRSSPPGAPSPPTEPTHGSRWSPAGSTARRGCSSWSVDPSTIRRCSPISTCAPTTSCVDSSGDQVWFVDWAHAGLAARWVDYALLLADVVGSGSDVSTGGPIDVLSVWRSHPITGQYDPELLICVIAGLAAALHLLARRPTDLLLPHRSRWSAAMAAQMVPFVRQHTVR